MSESEKANILLVDDQPGKLTAHEAILADLGENIVKVGSGLKALEFLLKNECAVIVLDVNMPGMDGFEAASLIRERPSLERTPIIFVSAYNVSDLDRLKGYGIGGVDYLFVPVIPAILKAKVQVFVEVFRQKQVIRQQARELARQNREKEEQISVIQSLNDKLRAANEELETFSYSVSHDLRGPLRAINGFSEALLCDLKDHLDKEALDYLNRITKAATRMDALIRDLLEYSRVSKADLVFEPIDLGGIVTSILQTYDVLKVSQAMISVDAPLHNVVAHEGCLSQCLSNLLVNAVKFVPKGQVPNVRVRTELRDASVRIWVEDNGIGIDPSHYGRIFQMFGRVHDRNAYEGTGIGLTIVKKGVERMGGTVGFESQLGEGSKFWIELPRVVEEPTLPSTANRLSAATT
jgi:signal transduction histidine kinase